MNVRVAVAAAVLTMVAGAGRLHAQQPAETPQALYNRTCAACHGANGVPAPAMASSMGIPSFHDARVVGQPDSVLATAIRAGKGKMPAYGSRLSADQIHGLVVYIKSLRH